MALAPYATDHKNPHGPSDARPTALKVIRDQALDGKLTGQVFFITGGTSGIGLATVKALHATGADVYFTCRDAAKGSEVAEAILSDGQPGKVDWVEMELDSLASVQAGAAEFLRKSSKLINVLICNAGIRGYPKDKTVDGFELHFGTNHMGHFALFQELQHALAASSKPESQSRVVILSASGHRQSRIRFHDFNLDNGEYEPLLAYAQSKTANIYTALEIERRFGAKGIHGLAVHPGGIETALNRKTPPEQLAAVTRMPAVVSRMKSAEQGAATTVWAAVAKEWEGRGGRFLEDCRESEPWDGSMVPLSPGYGDHVYDAKDAAKLWDESLRMIAEAGRK